MSVRQLLGSLTLVVLTGTASAQSLRVDRTTYVELIRKTAIEQGVPPDLAEAVAQVETGFNPTAVGTVGEVGLMQVRPSTAAMLGFVGSTDDLAKPVENVRYGVTYLGGAWKLANGNICRALMKYRAGYNTEVMSPLSVSYCQRARTYLAGLGSPLAGGGEAMISQVTPTRGGIRKVGGRLPACTRGTPACSRVFWAMHEARIRRIVAQLHSVRRSGADPVVTLQTVRHENNNGRADNPSIRLSCIPQFWADTARRRHIQRRGHRELARNYACYGAPGQVPH